MGAEKRRVLRTLVDSPSKPNKSSLLSLKDVRGRKKAISFPWRISYLNLIFLFSCRAPQQSERNHTLLFSSETNLLGTTSCRRRKTSMEQTKSDKSTEHCYVS
ncbi:hypothetical protein AVEN_227464-1 [Araneus ventricosus]|uniref:Uncharacterized protein n=1 Tax=Araneus ventricosus TaxID=182803 RepID=A0A4Y2C391_ARAVE|nr:hypothetical protein AVEN_227464-1 [Araneus ventricosus]